MGCVLVVQAACYFFPVEIRDAFKVAPVPATESCFIHLYNQLAHRGMASHTESISSHFISYLSYFSSGEKKKEGGKKPHCGIEIKFKSCFVVGEKNYKVGVYRILGAAMIVSQPLLYKVVDHRKAERLVTPREK